MVCRFALRICAFLFLVHTEAIRPQRRRERQLRTAHARQRHHTLAAVQLTKEAEAARCSALTTELWVSLVIRAANTSDASAEAPNFTAQDAVTKENFVTDCTVVFNVSDEYLQHDVVQELCIKNKGTAEECKNMVAGLWKAFNASDLEPWCAETYEWFEAKTKPKCLSKCGALLCKGRCDAHDKLRDLQDREAAFAFRLNQTLTRQGKLNMTLADLENVSASIEAYNKSNVTTVSEQVTKFKATLEELGKNMSATQKAFADAKDAREAAWKDLLTKKQANSSTEADVEAAEKELNSTTDALDQVSKEKTELNAELVDIQGLLAKAVSKNNYRQKRLEEMQLEYDVMKNKVEADYDEAEKKRVAIVKTIEGLDQEQKVIEDALAPQLENQSSL